MLSEKDALAAIERRCLARERLNSAVAGGADGYLLEGQIFTYCVAGDVQLPANCPDRKSQTVVVQTLDFVHHNPLIQFASPAIKSQARQGCAELGPRKTGKHKSMVDASNE